MTLFPDTEPELPKPSRSSNYVLTAGNCHELIEELDAESIALAMFSPPYDQMRSYGQTSLTFDLNKLGHQLYRVLKPGGVAVMVIQDQTINGAKTLTTFRTILHWCDSVGFSLHETLIFSRHGAPGKRRRRFRLDHEYMPVFVKGDSPAHFSAEHAQMPVAYPQFRVSGVAQRQVDGTVTYRTNRSTLPTKDRGTIWYYMTSPNMAETDTIVKYAHPATYPDKLAYDHILCWTEPGDTVLDPFIGSGSTAVAALAAGRDCIGFDINPEYIELAERRCAALTTWSQQ